MLKKFAGVAILLVVFIGASLADTLKGAKITKIDGDKITVEYKEKKDVKTTEVNVKDAKVVAGKNKNAVADGLRALKVGDTVMIEHTGGKATEIVVSEKKKK